MATFTTKFNVGDFVYRIHYGAELDEADREGQKLFNSIMSGIEEKQIKSVFLNENGIMYQMDNDSIVEESELYSSQQEAYMKAITDLINHLKNNLKRAEKLFADSKKDFNQFLENLLNGDK